MLKKEKTGQDWETITLVERQLKIAKESKFVVTKTFTTGNKLKNLRTALRSCCHAMTMTTDITFVNSKYLPFFPSPDCFCNVPNIGGYYAELISRNSDGIFYVQKFAKAFFKQKLFKQKVKQKLNNEISIKTIKSFTTGKPKLSFTTTKKLQNGRQAFYGHGRPPGGHDEHDEEDV